MISKGLVLYALYLCLKLPKKGLMSYKTKVPKLVR